MTKEEREQETETMDTLLCYCIPNLQKLVHQAPQCGRVLDTYDIVAIMRKSWVYIKF